MVLLMLVQLVGRPEHSTFLILPESFRRLAASHSAHKAGIDSVSLVLTIGLTATPTFKPTKSNPTYQIYFHYNLI